MASKIVIKIIVVVILLFQLPFAQDKIVSLAPGYTYQLYKLKCGNSIIANTTYCNKPEAAQKKEKVGSILNIDVERIYALQPDLVIASTLTRKKQIRKLQQLGLRVEVFHRPRSLDGILKQYQRLGKYVGKQKLALHQLDSLSHEYQKVQSLVNRKNSYTVFFQIGTKPLYAANRSSFINSLITMVNCENVVKTNQSGAINRESIIAKDPAIILIALNDNKSTIAKEKWEKYNSLQAVRNQQIYTVDPDVFCTPTPFTFLDALQNMAQIIYPDIVQ